VLLVFFYSGRHFPNKSKRIPEANQKKVWGNIAKDRGLLLAVLYLPYVNIFK